MKLIELHILQSFPVTCLNRDDVGAPKSAVFGGVPRARVSSQCWKRAIRQDMFEKKPGLFAGKRGHFFAIPLQSALEKEGMNTPDAIKGSEKILNILGDQDKKYKNGYKTSVALYFSPQEIECIARAAAKDFINEKKIDPKKGDFKKAIKASNPKDLADIAIFGRMVANDHTLMLEGAGLFSHAISTHRVNNEIDFFSAIDDLKPEEAEGAGHIGTLEFNSACYYRYIGLNLNLLKDKDHLGHFDKEDIETTIDTFLRACILSVPVARKNSMLGHNPPAFVLGLVRKGHPLSLVNAFEKPIWDSNKGYITPSIDAMNSHYKAFKDTFNLETIHEDIIPDNDLKGFCDGMVQQCLI